jgi:hypothetical protein
VSNSDRYISKLSDKLATRPSRRSFLAFLGSATLGVGLALSGASAAFATCTPPDCPLNYGYPCHSQFPPCSGCTSGGCPSGYGHNDWNYCLAFCQYICSECCLDSVQCSCLDIRTGRACGGGVCSERPVA